ncbi:MAG TPA: polysaccharide biosynthesis protein, partial [Oligoflexia bacterium]|nr:polysaccharide biosynthesis protein [Oligoflexia bacterium]
LLVLDDNENLHGGAVHGVRIAGPLSSLAEKLETYKAVAAVFSAIPSLSRQRVEEIEGLCRRIGIAFKRLQSFEEIALADGLKPVEKIRVESLLEKEINVQHEEEIRQAVLGKHILVTGAGGSIGSELVRQVLAFSPAAITLFDSSEYNLFQIERELVPLHPAVRKNFSIGSIANLERIRQVVREARPEIVFHAAAYKHVPLMESNCYEAFVNNVLGTRNTLASCEECGVRRFVLISTDKAVCPVSVMGCSKRLTELFVAERLQDTNGAQGIRCSIVRFGNVINSAGSVIPLFKAQIESGGPVTVTHPDMERYFMSIREAVRLVLTAGVLSEGSGAYVLDMGEPIKIVEVAKKMLALYGRRDVSIVFTGLRPGERLTESLTYAFERTVPSRFAKVQQIVSLVPSQTVRVSEWVSNLEQRLGEFTDKEIGALMTGFVAEVERSFAEKSLNGHELEAS